MDILEFQVDALMRLCTAETESERVQARTDIRRMMEGYKARHISSDPEYLIREILLELGTPDHLLGHAYVVQGILLALEDRKYINNLMFGLYPQLALTFQATPAQVERAIRNLIEVTWTRGDMDILNRYFGNTISPDKGKPTNGEFLARIANIVKMRLREAA